MRFVCDLDICGESVECEVLMCDGEAEMLTSGAYNLSELLFLPHVNEAVMKAYNDYIGE